MLSTRSFFSGLVYLAVFQISHKAHFFLTFSAFLMSYSFFESQKTNPSEHSIKQVFKTLFNRYLRLTPIYAIVLLIATTLSAALNDTSSFLPLEDNEMNCKLYWWRNFLYIQNWWPMSEMCMSWSYYLASDFQLFFVACLLHMVYSK